MHGVALYFFSFWASTTWLLIGVITFGLRENAIIFWLIGVVVVWLWRGGYRRPLSEPMSCSKSTARVLRLLIAALSASAALAVWRVVLQVTDEKPVKALFGPAGEQHYGWAPAWAVPAIAGPVAFVMLSYAGYFWRPGGLVSALKRCVLAMLLAFVAARVIRNVGHVVLNIPDKSVLDALSVLPEMIYFAVQQAIPEISALGPYALVVYPAALLIALLEGWTPGAALARRRRDLSEQFGQSAQRK